MEKICGDWRLGARHDAPHGDLRMATEKTTATPSGNGDAGKDKKSMTRAELEEVVAMAELRAREAEAVLRLTEANAKLRKLKSEKKVLRPDF
jgi:hypothetical protein